ncbi:hypothetical protein [Nocardioides bruguierae]|uniref:hypothetical protein n=1 Tax=Nocardioides bruguierae TaxID=2945102 RepID=UPI0020221466|nr:hypothetical protein [Nocardioides bruguierae]MCL8026317.1 hypothetical protein [Nocardioides bruguierae]
MSDKNGRHLLGSKDMVDLLGEDDKVIGSVPKHWDETLLTPGTKKKGRSSGSRTASTGDGSNGSSTPSGSGSTPEPPAGNASLEDWTEYAKTSKGATDADLVDAEGKPLTRDALKAKFGPQAG